MRVKSILSLIAFFAAFTFSVMLISFPKGSFYSRINERRNTIQQQQNIRDIRNFLWEDINRGRERDQKLSRLDGVGNTFQTADNIQQIAEINEEYVSGSRNMNISDLPADFQQAWLAHMDAWQSQTNYFNEISTMSQTYADETVDDIKVNGRLFKIDSAAYRNQGDEINRTWYEVLRIGRKYGAYVPVR